MNENRVAIVKAGESISDSLKKAIGLVGGLRLNGGERAVIKPNICNAKNPYGMVTTDIELIKAMIDLLREKCSEITIVESDSVSGSAEERVNKSGLLEKIQEWNVKFQNLSNDAFEVQEIAGKKIRLPKTVTEADYFINMPKIKTEGHVKVTLSIKNLFGLIQRAEKNKLHSRLNTILPQLAKTIRNDLIVVDGMTAMEGNGPLIGTPKELGLIVVGMNPVSTDSVCARIMGLDPLEIEHIRRSYEMGLGEIELESIEILGERLETVAEDFERPYSIKATLKSIRSIGRIIF